MPRYTPLNTYQSDTDDPDKADWIARRLLTLRHDLKIAITNDRAPGSLIIGSWNIRAFDGGLPRLDESFHYIAEIIASFDICAIQEVKSDLAPLKHLVWLLGPQWEYFVTDVSDHEGGNYERMAFVYNTDCVSFRNLIGEIVVGRDALSSGNQIARSPFFAAFQAHWFRFTLVSSHILFGDTDAAGLQKRAEEITAITKALTKRAEKEDQVYIFLGDMNIDSADGPVMQALENSKMQVPDFPATNMAGDKFYDKIAFTVKGKSTRKTRLLRAGAFDWRDAIFGPSTRTADSAPDPADVTRISDADFRAYYGPRVAAHRARFGKAPYADFDGYYDQWMTHEMSDHLPIWVELETDYSDDYLRRFVTAD
ncbi:MAG: endonuclease/exonuclease/phosphatase family protein [Yoonia sp.]|uniref:endonuclease/exonuclease/phosphatase family protein n=1 Tax=Yoonia sp. TaxID=2212373 RepID=UPI003EF4B0D9